MTPKAQRIAIAEACGWKPIPRPPDEMRGLWSASMMKMYWDSKYLPDYTADLNAINQAETHAQLDFYPLREKYAANLSDICDRDKSPWPLWRSTAVQRAEAFLRTLGKWVEDEKKEAGT